MKILKNKMKITMTLAFKKLLVKILFFHDEFVKMKKYDYKNVEHKVHFYVYICVVA